MKLKISIPLALFFTISGFTVAADAQAKSCKLDLSVTQFQNDSETEEIPIQNAAATATNATGKITKASLFEAMPVFANLREGKYTITVTKAGYKRTVKAVEIDCDGLDDDGSVFEDIFLQKGSSKLTFRQENPPARRDVPVVIGRRNTDTPLSEEEVAPPPIKVEPRVPKMVSRGVINGSAVNLVKPEYPAAARAVNASGTVNVQVTLDEEGNVISAAATSGHPLLRASAVQAARASKFSRIADGKPVKSTGVVVYNFVP